MNKLEQCDIHTDEFWKLRYMAYGRAYSLSSDVWGDYGSRDLVKWWIKNAET